MSSQVLIPKLPGLFHTSLVTLKSPSPIGSRSVGTNHPIFSGASSLFNFGGAYLNAH